MAISFIGSAVGSSSPSTNTTITLPTLQAGDLIIIAAAVGDTANNGIPVPTGYSRVPGVAATIYSNDVNDVNLDLFYKIAVGGDSGAVVTLTATGGTNASNAGVAMVFRGVSPGNPFDTNANTASGISTSNADPPSHNWSGTAGGWTVIAAATGHTGGAGATFTFPTNYTTNAAQRAHDDTIDVLVGMGYRTNPADPEDPGAFTAATIGTAADNAWAAVTMSLKEPVTTQQSLNATATGVATLSAALSFSVAMSATAVGSATMSAVATFSRSLSAVAVGIADLVTQFIAGEGAVGQISRFVVRLINRALAIGRR